MRTAATATTLYKNERTWFYAMLAILLMVFTSYIYFLSASIVHVVMRKEIDTQIAQIGSQLSDLESHYIEAQHAVSEDIASMQGFTRTDEKIFINKSEATLVLLKN